MAGKCKSCGSGFVAATGICEKCRDGFALCNNCKSSWKSKSCPSCGSSFANWKIV